MPNLSDTTAPQQSVRWSATKRLIQAAALASTLIPLGAVAVEGALISCVTSEADSIGCNGVTGDYAGSGEQTNTWKFYETAVFDAQTQQYVFQDLLYNFEITGTPDGDFSLFVQDNHVAASESTEYTLPEGVDCIPIYDTNTCVTFNVQTVEGTAAWIGDYTILMRWFAPEGAPGSSAMKPLNDGNNHIYRAASGSLFDDQLVESLYDPNPDPIDPALSGKGDSFSSFIAGRDVANVPEPSMLLLLGSGLAAGLYRRRRQG
jgi:hypothetical protein